MEQFKAIDLRDFQKFWEKNAHFYDERDMEDFAQMLEDYKKYKENEGKEE